MGYAREVEMIAKARARDLLTTPYVFEPAEAAAMTRAGARLLAEEFRELAVFHITVILSGMVVRDSARQGAERVVRGIDGVENVVNTIEERLADTSEPVDQALAEFASQLARDRLTRPS